MPSPLTIETHPLPAIEHHGVRLTAFARAWQLRLPENVPLVRGGVIWNRPVSVLATYPDGREIVMPVPDPTRNIVWTLAGICLLMLLAAVLYRGGVKEK